MTTISRLARLIWAEMLYNIWTTFAGWRQVILLTAGLGGVIAAISVGVRDMLPADLRGVPRVDALILFAISMAGLSGPVRVFEEHRMAGTLEQAYLSPSSLRTLGAVRACFSLIAYLPAMAGAAMYLTMFGEPAVHVTWVTVAIWALLFLGSLGNGFALGSLSLLGSRGSSALALVSVTTLGLALTDIRTMPWTRWVTILPIGGAGAVLHGVKGAYTWVAVLGFAGVAFLNLCVGIMIFEWGRRRALTLGTLVRYT